MVTVYGLHRMEKAREQAVWAAGVQGEAGACWQVRPFEGCVGASGGVGSRYTVNALGRSQDRLPGPHPGDVVTPWGTVVRPWSPILGRTIPSPDWTS